MQSFDGSTCHTSDCLHCPFNKCIFIYFGFFGLVSKQSIYIFSHTQKNFKYYNSFGRRNLSISVLRTLLLLFVEIVSLTQSVPRPQWVQLDNRIEQRARLVERLAERLAQFLVLGELEQVQLAQ